MWHQFSSKAGVSSNMKREYAETLGFLVVTKMVLTMSIMFSQLQAAILVLIVVHVQRRWRYLYASSSSACGNIVRPILAIATWKN